MVGYFPSIETYWASWNLVKLESLNGLLSDGTRPLSEPMLANCQLDPWEQISVKFPPKFVVCCPENATENVVRLSARWRPFSWDLNTLVLLSSHIGNFLPGLFWSCYSYWWINVDCLLFRVTSMALRQQNGFPVSVTQPGRIWVKWSNIVN